MQERVRVAIQEMISLNVIWKSWNWLNPAFVLIENVRGISTVFGSKDLNHVRNRCENSRSYATRIRDRLMKCGYVVQQDLVRAVDFGVPQLRPRHFTVGMRHDLFRSNALPDFFSILRTFRSAFLTSKQLPISRPVSVEEAISDLRTECADLTECIDPDSPVGFTEIVYKGPESYYQRLMHRGTKWIETQ